MAQEINLTLTGYRADEVQPHTNDRRKRNPWRKEGEASE